jgi:hypothetical protein
VIQEIETTWESLTETLQIMNLDNLQKRVARTDQSLHLITEVLVQVDCSVSSIV